MLLAAALVSLLAVTPAPAPAAAAERTLQLQVLLDRAHFSPGQIDGAMGANVRLAAAGWARAHGLRSADAEAVRRALAAADHEPALVAYTIAPEDVAGPFVKIPTDMMEKAALPALGYTSPLEALAERFHASPSLLAKLNPGKPFGTAGTQIQVPNAERAPIAGKAASVVVDQSDQSLTAMDAQGGVLARYPATMGSEHDPLPLGKWTINGVQKNPTFLYNAKLFWDADEKSAKAKIPAGPNNPVGVVWIDLSKPHYGIHGTPEPATIGKTESHGCIRLTNWDAQELAGLVAPGTPALLQE
jgi:lipoprotein-anchoring transpeptidase ErfK/SrfK